MLKKFLIPFLFICFLLVACSGEKSREVWINKNSEEIVFGLAYPFTVTEASTGFLNGVDLAVDEINTKGVLGKQVRLIKKDDKGLVTTGSEIAQSFVNNHEVSAVIGHWNSRVSNAVADIYNRNQMVMITPASTSPLLTQQNYKYIFRCISDDIDYGNAMVKYAEKSGFDRIAIYYSEDDYGRGLANAFEDAAYKNGIEVVDRTTYINKKNIGQTLEKWNAFDYNAIFIADTVPSAMEVIKTIRAAGVELPILGGSGIDVDTLIESLGIYSEGICIPTEYNSSEESGEALVFQNNYRTKYGHSPDTWAAQGYDTVKILCRAVEDAGSPIPQEISEALHNIKDYSGITGHLSCNKMGEIMSGQINVKTVKNGKYIYLGKY